MSYLAKIIGVSGLERYLARAGGETTEKKRARRFRSDEAARQAAHAPGGVRARGATRDAL